METVEYLARPPFPGLQPHLLGVANWALVGIRPVTLPIGEQVPTSNQLAAADTVVVSLEVIAGLESNSKIFTVYVHGLLQLQAGQYTSIFIDNSAGAPITIQNGSDFMGMFMGV
ncbi:UNVERIFIED_CONTAM: hypothetical protein K2H54_009423 [Gekko kuhli]